MGMTVDANVPYAKKSVVPSRWENMWQTFEFTCQHFMKTKRDWTLIEFMFFMTKLVCYKELYKSSSVNNYFVHLSFKKAPYFEFE